MLKKLAAFSAGVAMLAMATIVPVMAQTSDAASPDVNVKVNDYLTFAIGNPAADCTLAAGGDCPFGGTGVTSLTPVSSANVFKYGSADGSTTRLDTTTNSTDGYNVTAYATDPDSRTQTLCLTGTLNCFTTSGAQITDSVTRLPTAQAANDTLVEASDTGLAFRLQSTGAGTDVIVHGADEDTQWGNNDLAAALWASLPLGSGAAKMVYDTDLAYNGPLSSAFVDWFVGVASTQQAGNYNGTVTFTAAVNP